MLMLNYEPSIILSSIGFIQIQPMLMLNKNIGGYYVEGDRIQIQPMLMLNELWGKYRAWKQKTIQIQPMLMLNY